MTLYQGKYRIESSRFRGWDYASRGWYFVTVCSHHRKPIFGAILSGEARLSSLGKIADSELRQLSSHYDQVDVMEYVVMPNHVHAIIMIDGQHMFSPRIQTLDQSPGTTFSPPKPGSLSAIIRSYKAGVTRRARQAGFTEEIWQARFYDHILRGEKVIAAVREYIRNNPQDWECDRDHPQHDFFVPDFRLG